MTENYPNNYFSRSTFKDHLFWIFLFLFTDPGGIIRASSGSKYYVNIGIFLCMTFLFFFTTGLKGCLKTRDIRVISVAIFIWASYYSLIFGFFNNKATDFVTFLKSGFLSPFMGMCIFYFTYFFAVRNIKLFIKYLVIFSTIVFTLFFITYLTDLKILTFRVLDRLYVEQDRILLRGYGIIPIVIPLALTSLFFRVDLKERTILRLLAGIMIVLWIISITRRQILEILAYAVVAYFLAIRLKFSTTINPARLVPFVTVPLLILLLVFPSYINTTLISLQESYSVITAGETTSGHKDTRLSLRGQDFIVDRFMENPGLGTGYNPLWLSSEGDARGYEASDYIFLGSLAQHGVIGLLIFLPIYIIVYRLAYSEYRSLKRHKVSGYVSEYDVLIVIYVIITLILKMLVYVNYFTEAGWAVNSYGFYMITGLLFAVNYRSRLARNSLFEAN